MSEDALLRDARIVAFLPSTDLERSRSFFTETLGLSVVTDDSPFALVFDAAGTMLRVTLVRELLPDPFTVLGWDVDSIEQVVKKLQARGIEFLRYSGMNDKHPLAIWASPSGAQIFGSKTQMKTC